MEDPEGEELRKERRKCLCWTVRQCLFLWAGLSIVNSIILLICFYFSGYWDFHHGVNVIALITVLLNLTVSSFEMVAALLKRAKLLLICFYSVCLYVVYIVMALITSLLFMTGMFGEPALQLDSSLQEFLVVMLMVVYSSILLVIQIFLGWSVRQEWKESLFESQRVDSSV